ncbi:hypothetical protein NM208_g9069 [Fusarium decemcellulare]|uniref:Uncharacterized protein n=1 Tax=Fusarium decemcellulare TaxID=57161 RepID=A0ACC1S3J2_9HYPO|nr:hypothetical protein NM208_g9069 [Fusarium decemcellulare]
MATGAQSFYELYRRSSIGLALTDTLDDLISDERINPQLAMKILGNFDQAITEALQKNVKARLQFKGSLDTYRFCDEVWTFLIKNVTFKMDSGSQSVTANKVKIAVSQGRYSDAPPLKPLGFLSLSLALQGTSNRAAQEEPSRSSIIQGGPSILTKTQHPKPPVLEAAMLRKRQSKASPSDQPPTSSSTDEMSPPGAWSLRSQWMFFAVASGACAAFNGVFAKLTTTQLTTTLSTKIADLLGLSSAENIVEYAVRGLFFVLNLTFNGVMWTLFTKALARGTSTTQVSIMNTSTNFMVTALAGRRHFSEVLPPLWWAGAALLVAGNVIVGRKDESKDAGAAAAAEGPAYVPVPAEDEGAARKDDDEDDIIDLGRLSDERSR